MTHDSHFTALHWDVSAASSPPADLVPFAMFCLGHGVSIFPGSLILLNDKRAHIGLALSICQALIKACMTCSQQALRRSNESSM